MDLNDSKLIVYFRIYILFLVCIIDLQKKFCGRGFLEDITEFFSRFKTDSTMILIRFHNS